MSDKRQPRQSKEELRALLLEAGSSILREEGLGTGAEALTFKRVFDRVEQDTGIRLTNASIIRRVWENQAEFQTDVLVAIASESGETDVQRTIAAVTHVFEGMDRTTPEKRLATLRELIRVGGDASILKLRFSSEWESWMGIWALAPQNKSAVHRQRIQTALTDGYEVYTEQYEAAYRGLTQTLGMRLREKLTLRQFTIAAESFGEGCELRRRVDPRGMETILRATGPNGEDQPWTLYAVGIEGLVHQFFELDPHWRLEDNPL
jgi:hypothetical protein